MQMDFLPTWPLQLNTLFFFGFLLFCGALGGFLAHRMSWLPSITGFMLVGLVAGPNVLGIFDYASLADARIVVDIALALILYRLGLSLDIKSLFHDKGLLLVSLVESALTFVVVYFAMSLFGIGPLVSAVVAAIAISSSPAVLLHVAHELGAHGKTTDRAEALVALNNVLAFLVFAGMLPALYQDTEAPLATMIGAPLYQLLGSTVLGLVLGVVVKTAEKQDLLANLEFGPAFELFFVALFVYAGASLHLKEMVAFAPAAAVYVIARSVAKWAGVAATGYAVGWHRRTHRNAGLMLLPMAGMAIGLANTMTEQFPIRAAEVASIVFAAVAVFETLGPPVVARALRWAGEVHGDNEDRGLTQADAVMEPMVVEASESEAASLNAQEKPAA